MSGLAAPCGRNMEDQPIRLLCRLQLDADALQPRHEGAAGLQTLDPPDGVVFSLDPPLGYEDTGHHDRQVRLFKSICCAALCRRSDGACSTRYRDVQYAVTATSHLPAP